MKRLHGLVSSWNVRLCLHHHSILSVYKDLRERGLSTGSITIESLIIGSVWEWLDKPARQRVVYCSERINRQITIFELVTLSAGFWSAPWCEFGFKTRSKGTIRLIRSIPSYLLDQNVETSVTSIVCQTFGSKERWQVSHQWEYYCPPGDKALTEDRVPNGPWVGDQVFSTAGGSLSSMRGQVETYSFKKGCEGFREERDFQK